MAIFNCRGKIKYVELPSRLAVKSEIENAITPREGEFECLKKRLPISLARESLTVGQIAVRIGIHLSYLNGYRKRKVSRANSGAVRNEACALLVYLRCYLRRLQLNVPLPDKPITGINDGFRKLLRVLEKYMSELTCVDDSVFHYAESILSAEHLQPQLHMYHMHLEARWLYMTLVRAREYRQIYVYDEDEGEDVYVRNPALETAIAETINDLVEIAGKLFARVAFKSQEENLMSETPYSCTCVRELWLMIQVFVDHLAKERKSKTFWEYLNHSLDVRILGSCGNAPAAASDSASATILRSSERRNPEVFCIWLICHLTILYGYGENGVYTGARSPRIRSNHEQVEKILKTFVNEGGKTGARNENDVELRGLLFMLEPLVCEWWKPCAEVVSLLWDCFNQRLDQPFQMRATGPWILPVTKRGPALMLKQVKERLDDNADRHKSMSSYGMFLRLLGKFLSKGRSADDQKNWHQLKGRIRSKFTKSKVANFSESGLYNFISLFLTVAVTVNTVEACTTMLDLMPSSVADGYDDRSKVLLWKGNLTVILLFAEQRMDLATIWELLVTEVDVISRRGDALSQTQMMSYIDAVNEILRSSDAAVPSEHSFIDKWIGRYFLGCSDYEAKVLITMLNNVFDKSLKYPNDRAASGVPMMWEAMWKHVAASVRTLVLDEKVYGNHHHILAKLAAHFTLGALREPAIAQRHGHSFVALFAHFTSLSEIKNIRIIRSYLAMILREKSAALALLKLMKDFDIFVVQTWVKCCVMLHDLENRETRDLTHYVMNSAEITKVIPSKNKRALVEDSNVQILDFMSALMERRQSLQTEQARSSLDARCREYFGQMEKWAMTPITEETKATALTEWIYRCVGTLILHCAPMLYVKTQPRNALYVLIKKFMLPSARIPDVIDIGGKIFWMVMSGVTKLDFRTDLTLQRMMLKLFNSYLSQLIKNASDNETQRVPEITDT